MLANVNQGIEWFADDKLHTKTTFPKWHSQFSQTWTVFFSEIHAPGCFSWIVTIKSRSDVERLPTHKILHIGGRGLWCTRLQWEGMRRGLWSSNWKNKNLQRSWSITKQFIGMCFVHVMCMKENDVGSLTSVQRERTRQQGTMSCWACMGGVHL